MTLEEYVKIFRDECQEHLGWKEARECEALWARGNSAHIYQELVKLSPRIPSQRFKKAVWEFFWEQVY